MKNIFVFGILLLACACSEEQLKVYEGECNSVYFGKDQGEQALGYVDSLMTSFALSNASDSLVQLKICGLGEVTDFDRPLEVVVDSTTAEEGTHFEIIWDQCVLKAGRDVAYLPVLLHRTPDLTKTELAIHFRLASNEYFGQQMPFKKVGNKYLDIRRMSLYFTDKMVKPQVYMDTDAFFGYWSEAKFRTINTVLDIDPREWTDRKKFPIGRINGMVAFMRNYLNDLIDPDDPEGWKKVLKDPSPKSHRGYMTFPGVKIPVNWPDQPQDKNE